jgi:hypothetical protein
VRERNTEGKGAVEEGWRRRGREEGRKEGREGGRRGSGKGINPCRRHLQHVGDWRERS